ncbi:CCHC-type domain-containing protein [Nephila pilipes]|uniref:CCHC-type domain-containing protein n=1 Tax=Nephila pilipes TaxID=299642 RepID=A0A8X6QYT2_NEPPI|nr:CCHC-type domain-containing protein [Nephila pilipes]
MRKSTPSYHQKKMFPVKQPPQDRKLHFQRCDKVKKEESSEVICYGCGTPGVIKPKCPSCKGKGKRNHGAFSSVCLQSVSCPSKQLATLEVIINGVMGTACADTAATHSIAGETLYHILKKQGTTFSTGSLIVCLADGSKIEREVNTTCVKIRLGGRTLPLNLVVIPGAKNNNTLLGMDFLESFGIVLNVKRKTWFFDDQPKRQFHFVEQIQESCDAVKSNVSQTAAPLTIKETDHPDLSHAEEVNHLTSIQQLELKDHPDQLREDEGTHLTAIQRKKLNELLFRYRNSFCLGGEATPFIEHYIDTQNHPPVSVPPYRVSPARKETMKNAGVTSKFMPRRDGPFVIVERKSPVSYSVANIDSPQLPVGVYHTSALTPFQGNVIPPVKALRRRGRPARIIKPSSPTPVNAQKHKGSQNTSSADPWSGPLRGQRGSCNRWF